MEQFPHLKFLRKLKGKPRLSGGGNQHPDSAKNRANRPQHSAKLAAASFKLKSDWDTLMVARTQAGMAPLELEVVPLFLKVNPGIIDADFSLQTLGIEIISEEDDGFIIGASVDNLRSLEQKIQEFVRKKRGSGIIAELWEITTGNRIHWRREHILSRVLFEQWHTIHDDQIYKVEVSIAFDRPLRSEPDPTKKGGIKRYEAYTEDLFDREMQMWERQDNFEKFIHFYGKITSSIVELDDCFGCEIEVNGKGLKDLVENYPYVFEVNELEDISVGFAGEANELEWEIEIIPPDETAPTVCVIDSGIMENHRYLEPSIDFGRSTSYLADDFSTADKVKGGGHGTRVAGAILYPNGISNYPSPYPLPCKLRNLRVLDSSNYLLHRYPASLMKQIVDDHNDCSIFNLSICSKNTYRRKHMSVWAACLDKEIFEKNIIFVVATGNISKEVIATFLKTGQAYPAYFQKPFCLVANPAQSFFAISVGSVNHTDFEDESWLQLGGKLDIAAYSRPGPGIWQTIKPDVVEFGGGIVVSKSSRLSVKEAKETGSELLRSTLDGGGFNGFDAVGTSFAAPKVTHIIAVLKGLYPNETSNLLRALLVQGARLPGEHFRAPTSIGLNYYGFGLPSITRVTSNTDYRVSFYNTAAIQAEEAHLYSLKIPESLRNPGDDFEILIEVSLAYTAKVRRTRQKPKSYLATWLDWDNARLGEPFDLFQKYALKEIEGKTTVYDKEKRDRFENIRWLIGNRVNSGTVEERRRSDNSMQKDWAFLRSYELPEEISFSVRAHKGWDKNKAPIPYAFVVSLEILGQNIPIYEAIRIENEVEIET